MPHCLKPVRRNGATFCDLHIGVQKTIETPNCPRMLMQSKVSMLLEDFNVLDDSGYVVAGEDGGTSCSGLFVAGDARTKNLRQVVTAASDGANAMYSIMQLLSK